MHRDTIESIPISVAECGNTLMIRRCEDCELPFAPLTAICASCGTSDLTWVPSSGTGSIVSCRPVNSGVSGLPTELGPYAVAIVELDDGPWLSTIVEGNVPSLYGRSVRAQFKQCPPVGHNPVFVVCSDTARASVDVRGAHASTRTVRSRRKPTRSYASA